MNKIPGIITARCGSRRFPAKVIAPLGGKPMIVQIINRLQEMSSIGQIVVSTTNNKEDDILALIAENHGASVYRGRDKDLGHRHYHTHTHYGIDHAFKLSGDSPFFDPRVGERLITAYFENPEYDYYNMKLWHCLVGGDCGSIVNLWWVNILWRCAKRQTNFEEIQEAYWMVTRDEKLKEKMDQQLNYLFVDCDDLAPKSDTPPKTSIDYPLELAVYNRIIEYIGRMPKDYDEIVEAFTEIKEL